MPNSLAGDTVNPTKSTTGEPAVLARGEKSMTRRKRRRLEPFTANAEVPEKAQRREEGLDRDVAHHALPPLKSPANLNLTSGTSHCHSRHSDNETNRSRQEFEDVAKDEGGVPCYTKMRANRDLTTTQRTLSKSPTDDREFERIESPANTRRKKLEAQPQQESRKRDEATRLRKTIQWLEEGGRRLREDLANARTELHEERRAAKIGRRETEAAIREARAAEAAKYHMVIAELKARLARSSPMEGASSACQPSSAASRLEFMKEEHHKREISALKKRLSETEGTIRRLKWESLNLQGKSTCKAGGASSCPEVRRLDIEVRNLRANNEKLEDKLRIAQEAERLRTAELRIQHENHEAELSSLRKSLRTETIKMMDELRVKSREIEKLSKLTRADEPRKRRKTASTKDDVTMRKLRENERSEPIRSASRMVNKFLPDDTHAVDSYMREEGCDRAITEIEVERLRELALEQQEVIEILRQAVKEKERKLEQLSNKRRKEEFYRQWLELEPVVEVDDEEDHEEGDSALSSAPSSLSPQPGCGQWQGNGVTREAYEAVLVEMEGLQAKLYNERQELAMTRTQVRDLEKALLQEARCEKRNKELNAMSEKLRMTEEREATLLVELSELREQNELLEFRLLELEETSARRGSPDHTADSGIVSPEPIHATKDYLNKQRNRAVATVIPYTSVNTRSISPGPRKPPLSLQESGIFEEDVDLEDDNDDDLEIQLANCGTQTEVPGGELLQEVQRLQELQARIQERVTNPMLCPIEQTKSVASLESMNDGDDDDSMDRLSSYQERISQLEERLEATEGEVEARLREKKLSKQREEDLLDENYRLTERVYWLENELKNTGKLNEGPESPMDCESLHTEDEGFGAEEARKITSDQIMQETGMEDQGSICEPSELPEDEETSTEEATLTSKISSSEKSVQTMDLPNTRNCPTCQNSGVLPEQVFSTRWNPGGKEPPLMIVEELAKEAKEVEDENENDAEEESSKDTDEVDSGRGSLSRSFCSVSQVFVVPEEEIPASVRMEPVVSISEPESEKKVRQKRTMSIEKEGWAMKSWDLHRINTIEENFPLQRRQSRLVLYQEICV